MRYGVPYKGSKNNIAEWIYSHFPKVSNFYDLFAGGCAVTQIALMKQEFKNYFCNDIDNSGINLFLNAIYGKYQNETRWISREDFFRLKDSDPYIKYVWSFGNNGRDYLYSKKIEPYKKAVHFAVVDSDYSLLTEYFPNTDFSFLNYYKDIHSRKLNLQRFLRRNGIAKGTIFESQVENMIISQNLNTLEELNNLFRLINIGRQQQLESLNRLQSLHNYSLSFDEVKILPDSVVYCDIPYINTNAYGNKKDNHSFNREKFYEWCRRQSELVIISEYTMPDNFICIDEIERKVTLCAGGDHSAMERLFIPEHQAELWQKIKPVKWFQQELFFM